MKNITQIVHSGVCTGCGACGACDAIRFILNQKGFYSPVVDEGSCVACGGCLNECIYALGADGYDDE